MTKILSTSTGLASKALKPTVHTPPECQADPPLGRNNCSQGCPERSGGRRNIEVDFFGGEPLMAMDTVKATVEYARSLEQKHNKNFRFTIKSPVEAKQYWQRRLQS